jgi:hypothetical protein
VEFGFARFTGSEKNDNMAKAIIDLTKHTAGPEIREEPGSFAIKHPLLHDAPRQILRPRLVQIAETICLASDNTAKLFEEQLVVPAKPIANRKRSASNDLEANILKRKRVRHMKCTRCEKDFDVEDNRKGWCEYHPGKLSGFSFQICC